MIRRLLFPFAALVMVALVGAPIASADPINNPNSNMVTVSCDNGQTYTVASNEKGNFTPGLDVDSTMVGQPWSFTFTATQVSTGTVVFSQTVYKGGGNAQANGFEGKLLTCSGDMGTFVDPSNPQLGLLDQTLQVVIALTPRNN